ncbi:MAG: ATP-binding cassette domain-containing protein [Anaerolineales bacterium]
MVDSPSSQAPCILVQGLVKRYRYQTVLNQLNLTLQDDTLCILIGENGVGKTTLLRILSSLTRPDEGKIFFEGLPSSEGPPLRGQIGYIGHQSMLYGSLSAFANLMHYANLYQLPNPAESVHASLASAGLASLKDKPVRNLSRGIQQRLSIARSLLHNPSIILMDEPYTGLDFEAAASLDETLTQLRRPGRIILIADHQPQRMFPFASHLAWLNDGKIVHYVPINQINDHPELEHFLRGII